MTYDGRATRPDFWWFFLANFLLIPSAAGAVGAFVPTMIYLATIYGFASMIPTVSLGARRLRDAGRSAWCLLTLLLLVADSVLSRFVDREVGVVVFFVGW